MTIDDWAASQTAPLDDETLIREAQARGYLIHKPQPAVKPVDFDLDRLKGDRIRFGVISDTHFGSKYQQPTLLKEHLRYFKQRKVDAVLYAGDVCDGAVSMHPGFVYETWAHGADRQVEVACEVLVPEAKKLGVPWYVIGGNHDYSLYKEGGTDVVAHICSESEHLNYLIPDIEGNHRGSVGHIRFGSLLVQLAHPHMGSSYALSYRLQKWIEQLAPENKPHVVIHGNFHKCLQLDYRNVFALMVPSFQSQSGWMASKSISSYVGSAILEVGTEPLGMAPSVQMEWLLERVPRQGDWPGGGDGR